MQSSAVSAPVRSRPVTPQVGHQETPSFAIWPVGVQRSTLYFPEIEALRGIAITLVFFYHAHGLIGEETGGGGPLASTLAALIQEGNTGVSLFFILSGFLLSLPFLREVAGGSRVNRIHYYQRRALRILPLYYAAVLVAAVFSATAPRDVLRAVPHMVFLNSANGYYTPLWPYSSVWWSLATEVQFYALLPLLAIVVATRRGRQIAAVLLALYLATYVGFLQQRVGPDTIDGRLHLGWSLFGRGPLFLYGILAAWVYLHHGEQIRLRLVRIRWVADGGADCAGFAGLVLLAVLLRWVAFHGYFQMETAPLHAWHILEGILWTAGLLLVLLAPLRLKPLITHSTLGTIGILSYSIYILHFPLLWFTILTLRQKYPIAFARGWNPLTLSTVAAIAAVCLGLSMLTYRFIERPFLARKAQLAR